MILFYLAVSVSWVQHPVSDVWWAFTQLHRAGVSLCPFRWHCSTCNRSDINIQHMWQWIGYNSPCIHSTIILFFMYARCFQRILAMGIYQYVHVHVAGGLWLIWCSFIHYTFMFSLCVREFFISTVCRAQLWLDDVWIIQPGIVHRWEFPSALTSHHQTGDTHTRVQGWTICKSACMPAQC